MVQIEDVHLANLSVCELIRSLVDKKGWFNLSTFEWQKIEDCVVLASMRNNAKKLPSNRLIRHFNEICLLEDK